VSTSQTLPQAPVSASLPSSPLVSILINNYNYGRFLDEAIQSALNQTYDRVEVVVVDDGSTDNSAAVIKAYGDRITAILKPNGGQASAFNAGVAASTGDIICFLDSDDIVTPTKAAQIAEVFQQHPKAAWCFHPLPLVDTHLQPLSTPSMTSQATYCDVRAAIQVGTLIGKLPFSPPATSGLCFRRSLIQQIFPMPEAESISLNDTYLQCSSFALAPGVALDQPLALQRVHGNNNLTQRVNNYHVYAAVQCTSAYWLRINFPVIARFSDNLLAAALATYWRRGYNSDYARTVVKNYLALITPWQRLRIFTKAAYYSTFEMSQIYKTREAIQRFITPALR
jgi:glycosyltransferase involved in cell wall biosynthesis